MAKENEVYLYCQVIQNCYGEKRPIKAGGKPHLKKFEAGTKILGKAFNASHIPTQYTPAVITKDRFIITQNNLMLLGEEQEAQVIQDKEIASKELKNKFKSFYNANGVDGIMTDQKKRSKYMMNGAIIGGVTILLYAMMKGQNKMNGFILGAVLGGLAGKFVGDYVTKKQ